MKKKLFISLVLFVSMIGITSVTVSYTHLDVYKRQPFML